LFDFFTALAVLDMSHADVELLPLVKRDVGLDRLSLVVLGSLCLLIGFLRGSELVELFLDSLVLDLLEEQVRLTELMTGLEQCRCCRAQPSRSSPC
jgi:hypothetical protein